MSVGAGLALMVVRGRLTLDDLDQPSGGWAEIERDRRRSVFPCPGSGWQGRRVPVVPYPSAGAGLPVRNLAREWIEANPRQWEALLLTAWRERQVA